MYASIVTFNGMSHPLLSTNSIRQLWKIQGTHLFQLIQLAHTLTQMKRNE